MKLLFIIDMQNDFIDGVLGSPEAQAIVPKVIEKIKQVNKNDLIFVTYDTHFNNYLDTEEGKHLPIPHCIAKTDGIKLNKDIREILMEDTMAGKVIRKPKSSFGYPWTGQTRFSGYPWGGLCDDEDITEIEIVGLDTDFCVLANALGLKAAYPNVPITIDAACCAGSTPEWHEKALNMLEHCHFNVINRKKE